MSKVRDLLTRVSLRVKDADCKVYSEYELLEYFNDACDFLSMELISQKDIDMICETTQTMGMPLPDEFVEWAGQHPLYVADGKAVAQDGVSSALPIRYWAKKARVRIDGDSPFRSMYDTVLVQVASIYAMARDTGGIPTDQGLLDQVRANIAALRSKRQMAAQ